MSKRRPVCWLGAPYTLAALRIATHEDLRFWSAQAIELHWGLLQAIGGSTVERLGAQCMRGDGRASCPAS